jgi:hypothetical protein
MGCAVHNNEEAKTMKSDKMLIGAALVGILIIAVQTMPLLLSVGCGKETAPAKPPATPTTLKETSKEPCNVVINCDNIKKLPNGKYRYFFHVYNEGEKNFVGEVAIKFVSADGSSMPWDKDKINAPIRPKSGTFIYIDDYLGPPCVHGSDGYASFKYKAGGKGYKPTEGTGQVPNGYDYQ